MMVGLITPLCLVTEMNDYKGLTEIESKNRAQILFLDNFSVTNMPFVLSTGHFKNNIYKTYC